MSLSPERRARLALVISAHRAARRVLTPSSPSQVEEEIQTLSQVLAAKEKHLAEIKRKLGIGSLQELRENLARAWQEREGQGRMSSGNTILSSGSRHEFSKGQRRGYL